MPANLENLAVLEKVKFHFNPKEGQCQGMFCLGGKDGIFTGLEQGEVSGSSASFGSRC